MRIHKYIAESGLCSRRKAEELIKKGEIFVNGKKAEIGQIVEETDVVTYKNKVLKKEENEYYLLNKPLGYICTNDEQFGRDKAVDLIKSNKRLVTAGRLDMYTTGAIIVTNDGELINSLMHPRKEIEKEYYVTIKGKIDDSSLKKLKNGLEIEVNEKTYKTKGAKVKILGVNQEKNTSRLSITISEGKNRQVRKMLKTLGYNVIALHRNRVAFLDVKKIKQGEYVNLDKSIVKKLKML